MVSPEIIENFLRGRNPLKYVVAIEGGYSEPSVNLIINDPERGKYIQAQRYRPFIWFKEDVKHLMYGGDRRKIKEAADRHEIRFKKLKTDDENGFTPERLDAGYKFIATTSESYNTLVNFFRNAGVDIFDVKYKHLFFQYTPVEQFMIQTGVRLFKGMEDYDNLHRLQFDLETTGLTSKKDSIFDIGIKDNRGFEHTLSVTGNTAQERRNSERQIIIEFFRIINELKPDVIGGYNSEQFDWPFIEGRCERLNINLQSIAIGYDGVTALRRKAAILKLGNETENFDQTYLWGTNIIDIAHAVRRAQAINSNIKSWSLKWITQFAKLAKKNRVYVKGDKIFTIWDDKESQYAFNDVNGDWYKISDRMSLKEPYKIVTGAYIIERYLLDDLWETEQVDTSFNQAAFLIAKLLPTTYGRSTTMGTATQWKLIMAAWSYENDLAIPVTTPKRDFTGGLSRLLAVGYSKNVVKFDFAALYPKTQLTHSIFPDLDISHVMHGILTYIVDTRDEAKFLMEGYKDTIKKLKKELETASRERGFEIEKGIKENEALASFYDKKQMPLKILANSWFGAYGATYIFNWGDTNCAEETTCRGRQYFRLMVGWFTEKHNFKALVGDTDGFNFQVPEGIENFKYTAKGTHWKTVNDANVELSGVDAVLAEFNEKFMIGRMGLDIDEVCRATINFSRKNYATDVDGKIKFVGNSIKSKKMPVYIEDFLDKAIRLLLDGNGKEFINHYYDYVDKIYNYNIPLVKIASKSKVKSSLDEYKARANRKNKAGKPMAKQAHMELALHEGLDINLGDTIFYVNTGTGKGDGDVKTVKLENGKSEVKINCKLINPLTVELNLEVIKEIETLRKIMAESGETEEHLEKIKELEVTLLTDEYNVAKYLQALNKKVEPLLVCFHPDIRKKIMLSIKKDRKTKIEKLTDRNVFSTEQCTLVSGMADEPGDQDTMDDVMVMEDKEIKFWYSVNMVPNNIEREKWDEVLADYHIRMEIQRQEGIVFETQKLDEIFRRFEVRDLNEMYETKIIPDVILNFVRITEEGELISKKWNVKLYEFEDIFKYEPDSIERDKWYQLSNNISNDRYDMWLALQTSIGDDTTNQFIAPSKVKKIEPIEVETDDEEEEDDEDEIVEDETTMLEEIQKEINSLNPLAIPKAVEKFNDRDIFPQKAEPVKAIPVPEPEEKDEWNF